MGANNVLGESFGRNVLGETFWAVLLLEPHFASGAWCWAGWRSWAGLGWAGLGAGLVWALGLGWGLGLGGLGVAGLLAGLALRAGPETEIGLFENGNWATEKFWAKRLGSLEPHFASGAGCWNWFMRKWQHCVPTENMSCRMANSNKQFLFISFLRV